MYLNIRNSLLWTVSLCLSPKKNDGFGFKLETNRKEDLQVENMLGEQKNEQRGMKDRLMLAICLKKMDLLDEDQDL